LVQLHFVDILSKKHNISIDIERGERFQRVAGARKIDFFCQFWPLRERAT